MSSVTCDYCAQNAERVSGAVLYPHRPDLAHKTFWRCEPCGAHVGCHPGGDKPLGRLADAELRRWKGRAHGAFDPLWKSGHMRRKDAYKWLARQLGIKPKDCHIGTMDIPTCQRVVEICRALRAEDDGESQHGAHQGAGQQARHTEDEASHKPDHEASHPLAQAIT